VIWAAPMPLSALASSRVGAIRCRGFKRGVAQLGSALRSGRRGRGFESRHPDHGLAIQKPSIWPMLMPPVPAYGVTKLFVDSGVPK
jgi:hypothetical protein